MNHITLALFFFIYPFLAFAQTTNVDFVDGLWYAHEPVFAEKNNRIYIAFRNNGSNDLSGTIRFSDNGKRIGSSDIHVLAGRLVEVWTDWVPTHGTHSILAEMNNAQFHILGGKTENIFTDGLVIENIVFVDVDTDEDSIGDTEDTDDDNDGISDTDEEKRGTDTKVANPKLETSEELDTEKEVAQVSQNTSSKITSGANTKGLEQYIGDGMMHATLSTVTKRIHDVKEKVDTYRSSRVPSETIPETQLLSQSTDTNNTITRTKHAETTLLQKFVDGVATVLKSIWTLMLWFISYTLEYPALIQFVFLILILYVLYRIIRKVGRRPTF